MEEQKPKVGIGVLIFKDGKILLHQRKGAHGEGEWAFPGGHLEYLERFEEAAVRETREECGIEIQNLRFQYVANVQQYSPKHYVHIGMLADWKSGEPEILEPDRSGPWDWYPLAHLPQPLFAMCELALDSFRTGKIYYNI